MGNKYSIHRTEWPIFDKKTLVQRVVELPVQINGKVRGRISVQTDYDEDKVREIVENNAGIKGYLGGKEVKRFIYVSNKIVNIVI